MRFSLFAHIERLSDEIPHQQLLDELIELVGIAEEAGFEIFWAGEHHGMEFTVSPNPFTLLAHVAARTSRIRLGTGTVVAPFWHPIRLAGEAAMTDILCAGRLDIGIARGAYSFEYQRIGTGIDATEAGARLREMVPLLQKLWTGDCAHDGPFWSFPATTAVPSPLQRPHPPLWVAARDPSSHDFAVANGCNVQVTPLWLDDTEVETLMQRFEAACTANSDRQRPKIMLLRHIFVGETEAELDEAARALSRFYCHFGAWFRNERPVRRGFIELLSAGEMADMAIYSPEAMRANNVVGTPEQVIARLKTYEALGFDQFGLWLDNAMTHEKKRASLELFVREVMPAFDRAG